MQLLHGLCCFDFVSDIPYSSYFEPVLSDPNGKQNRPLRLGRLHLWDSGDGRCRVVDNVADEFIVVVELGPTAEPLADKSHRCFHFRLAAWTSGLSGR